MKHLMTHAALFLCSLSQIAVAQTGLLNRFAQPHPTTIRGQATNQDGQPLAGASIFVISTNRIRPGGQDSLVAKTVTDETGSYLLPDVPLPILAPDGGPIKKYSEGAFQVFGVAPGYGFTWRPEQFVRPEPRPSESKTGPQVFHAGETCIADLAFDLPATIEGRLVNDRDQPLAGVKVEVGYVHNVRRPGSYGISSCRYLGSPNAAGNPPDDSFDAMNRLPEATHLAITDRDGRYKISGLRRETVYGVLIDYRPNLDPLDIYVATTTGDKGRADRRLGYTARLDHVFVEPPQVTVHVATAGGVPLENVTVRARRKQLLRSGNVAQTDVAGKALLDLPADSYTLFIEPSFAAPYLPGETELYVTGNPLSQSTRVTLEPAATLLLSTVEAETNRPLAGVSFFQQSDSGKGRRPLHSQLVVADYPLTSEAGELRAILPPGRVRLVVDKFPRGYEPVRSASELLSLTASTPTTARFEFRKTGAAEPAEPEDELSPLRKLLAEQQSLPKSGTYLIKQAFVLSPTCTPDELRKLVDGWDRASAPDFFSYLQARLPKDAFRQNRTKVIIHGEKQRHESEYEVANLQGSRLAVSNGHENVVFDPANGQATLSTAIVGTTPQRFGPSPFSFCTLPSIAYARSLKMPNPRHTRENGKLVLRRSSPTTREILDEATGFLHHSWSQSGQDRGRGAWYFDSRRMEGGLMLAGLVIECQFNGDKLTRLSVLRLEEVSLATPPPSAFVVSAPAGTTLLDSRLGGFRATVKSVTYPLADVVMFANQIPASDRPSPPVLTIGQPAPPLQPLAWLNSAGQTPPPEQKGKVVLIDFWGVHCGPCVAELPDVQALVTEFAKKNFLLIGLHESSGELAEVAEFARQRGLTYQLAIDRPAADSLGFGATYKAYGTDAIPTCAVIDQQGRIAFLGKFSAAAIAAAKLLDQNK